MNQPEIRGLESIHQEMDRIESLVNRTVQNGMPADASPVREALLALSASVKRLCAAVTAAR